MIDFVKRALDEQQKKIYLVCPVRNAGPEESKRLENYVLGLYGQGYQVYYPKWHTDQTDANGYFICDANRRGLKNADEVHIYWNPSSQGSVFDIGMACAKMHFQPGKRVILANKQELAVSGEDYFTRLVFEMDERFSKQDNNFQKESLCYDSLKEMIEMEETPIYWNPSSRKCIFNFGLFFMLTEFEPEKRLRVLNPEAIVQKTHKDFNNVLSVVSRAYSW